ncbi:putative membrane protein [Candidatus Syntrophocurvum alkaliphilum]|uniref:Putative membrane protein n=1 Tax=Candidatus Syntrophocurvum alkaliphilum TaxID=2293317 RepID=A0A6I6DC55_9FIRM|nr:YIEGIA family protein [Candidatus Syntrophocurvum alkaliphilum]QGT99839.1 putative membrane protein [Candidatus Syntrophocurvum alkaliphilum]
MEDYAVAIIAGIVFGFAARWFMLKSDYRYYPTYPHGHVTHLSLGFIAAGLGAVAIPAIAEPDYVAITFLALAAQQFRDIRTMERETLKEADENKLIGRGPDYIEGIAKVFEARNYLVILIAIFNSGIAFWLDWYWVLITGPLSIFLIIKLMSGIIIGDIAEVVESKLHFEGSLLMVEDVVIMNVGLEETREKILNEGLAVLIKPKDDNARATLHSPGQRMAILYDAVSILGTKVDINEPELMPLARKNIDEGYLGFFLLPNEPDIKYLVEIIKRVPVLEATRGTPLSSLYGRKAAD